MGLGLQLISANPTLNPETNGFLTTEKVLVQNLNHEIKKVYIQFLFSISI